MCSNRTVRAKDGMVMGILGRLVVLECGGFEVRAGDSDRAK